MFEDMKYLGSKGAKITGKQATKLVIKLLYPEAHIIAVQKGIKSLDEEDKIMDLLDKVEDELETRLEAEAEMRKWNYCDRKNAQEDDGKRSDYNEESISRRQ